METGCEIPDTLYGLIANILELNSVPLRHWNIGILENGDPLAGTERSEGVRRVMGKWVLERWDNGLLGKSHLTWKLIMLKDRILPF